MRYVRSDILIFNPINAYYAAANEAKVINKKTRSLPMSLVRKDFNFSFETPKHCSTFTYRSGEDYNVSILQQRLKKKSSAFCCFHQEKNSNGHNAFTTKLAFANNTFKKRFEQCLLDKNMRGALDVLTEMKAPLTDGAYKAVVDIFTEFLLFEESIGVTISLRDRTVDPLLTSVRALGAPT
jgi:hypothetical protein